MIRLNAEKTIRTLEQSKEEVYNRQRRRHGRRHGTTTTTRRRHGDNGDSTEKPSFRKPKRGEHYEEVQ